MYKYTVTFHVEGAWEVDYSMTVEASNDEEAIAKVQKAMNNRAYNITTTRITP
jgi:predicted nuclease with TOPRIM domain